MSDTGLHARKTAVYLLDQVLQDGRLMSELLGAGALDKLPAEDRARAARLAMDTLRGLERADRLLQKHLHKRPPLTVQNVLRLGTVELCQGGAPHGVVSALVELVSRHPRYGHLKGLVNAVLRKIATQGPAAWNALRPSRLPNWLRDPLVQAWGRDAVQAMEAAHQSGAPLDLTARMSPQTPEPAAAAALAQRLGGTVLPSGSVRLHDAGQVSAMPGFSEGDWWVQDAAAALPARILAAAPKEKVLDMCAAPGGKTMQMAAAGADVTALDSSSARLTRLKENLARTGLAATITQGDARAAQGRFDAVLLDAPCSATGTMRRHPDLPHAKDGSEFAALIDLQADLIDHAWSLLPAGGRMVFCTCSLLPDEGEVQIDEALRRHADMRVDRDGLCVPGVERDWITPEGGLRLRPEYWPAYGGMDGFYIALMRKG
jgi:16S rRNA (cytosine967-C5)-methyltransferase